MKKIVIDARFYSKKTGGIGRYSKNLIKELAKIDKENQYFALIQTDAEKEWEIEEKNFSKLVVDINYFSFAEQTKLLFVLKKLKPDLVHFLNFNHPILYNQKFVSTIHDLTLNFFPAGKMSQSILRKTAYKTTMKHAIEKSDHIIVPSKATKDDLIEYLRAKNEKISITYEATDDDLKTVNTFRVAQIFEKFKIKKPYLLFVSQWRPHKGIIELLAAFEKILNNFPDLSLVIAGRGRADLGDLVEEVKVAQRRLPIVTTGFITDEELSALYQEAKLFIFPSHYEGFGLPMLEAAKFKIPIIASKASCMEEIMSDGAKYFRVGNEFDLANVVTEVLTDRALFSKLSIKAQERAKSFSWNKTAKETLAVYKKILAEK